MAARDPDPDHHPALRIPRRLAAATATPLGSRRSEARRPVRGPNEAAAGRRRSSGAAADGPISRNEFWVGELVGIRTRDLLIKSRVQTMILSPCSDTNPKTDGTNVGILLIFGCRLLIFGDRE